MVLFKDRAEAGSKLADALSKYQGENVIVFALPRGGVAVAAEIAKKLNAPLDLVITKKIGHPLNDEYAICAMAEDGQPICNASTIGAIDQAWLAQEFLKVRSEIKRRRKLYTGDIAQTTSEGKTAVIVDDGIATGLTMIAAIEEIRSKNPQKLVVAIPVTPYDTAQKLKLLADDLVSLSIDEKYLGSVGSYYLDFGQLEDSDVIELIKSTNKTIN